VCRYGKYCGFQALLAAYLVAVKQIMPDSELRLLFVLKLRAKVYSSTDPSAAAIL
jgi:hypothetical protein